jgi:lysophospholipase L1-like esterase
MPVMWHRLASMLFATALAVTGMATPAFATAAQAATTPNYYLALGDSLAYGYQPVRPLDRTEGYVYRISAARPDLTLDNLGCPGETTTSMIRGGRCPYPGGASQLVTAERFLRAHRGHVTLVTIDIGANDINPCAGNNTVDEACVDKALRTIAVNLARIVVRLRLAAPVTRIEAMNYYNPSLAAYLTGPAGQAFAKQVLDVGNTFNALLDLIYRLVGFRVADVSAAFSTNDTTPTTLPGVPGEVPLNVARICEWTWMCAPPPLGPDIHANNQGYAVIAHTFLTTH